MRARFQFGPFAMFLLLAGGCCASRGPDDTCCPVATPQLDCHAALRRPLIPDVFAVPIHGGVRPDAARIYCNLPEREAQCLAALKKSGTQRKFLDRMQTREELYALLDYKPEAK